MEKRRLTAINIQSGFHKADIAVEIIVTPAIISLVFSTERAECAELHQHAAAGQQMAAKAPHKAGIGIEHAKITCRNIDIAHGFGNVKAYTVVGQRHIASARFEQAHALCQRIVIRYHVGIPDTRYGRIHRRKHTVEMRCLMQNAIDIGYKLVPHAGRHQHTCNTPVRAVGLAHIHLQSGNG